MTTKRGTSSTKPLINPANPADPQKQIAPVLPGQPSVVNPNAAPGHANGPDGGNIQGPAMEQPD